jgi:hypothetical protein
LQDGVAVEDSLTPVPTIAETSDIILEQAIADTTDEPITVTIGEELETTTTAEQSNDTIETVADLPIDDKIDVPAADVEIIGEKNDAPAMIIADKIDVPIADKIDVPIADKIDVPIADKIDVPIADKIDVPIAESDVPISDVPIAEKIIAEKIIADVPIAEKIIADVPTTDALTIGEQANDTFEIMMVSPCLSLDEEA